MKAHKLYNRDEIDPAGAKERATAERAAAVYAEAADAHPLIEMAAREFGQHTRNGGWRLGFLAASSIEVGKGSGTNQYTKRGLTNCEASKVSLATFSKLAGLSTGGNTASKYLKAWDKAAVAGYIPRSSDLVPGEEVDFSKEDDAGNLILSEALWNHYFKPARQERPEIHPGKSLENIVKHLKKTREALKSEGVALWGSAHGMDYSWQELIELSQEAQQELDWVIQDTARLFALYNFPELKGLEKSGQPVGGHTKYFRKAGTDLLFVRDADGNAFVARSNLPVEETFTRQHTWMVLPEELVPQGLNEAPEAPEA